MTFNPTNSLGPFISTSTFFPDDFEEFRVKFLELYRDLSNAVNTREVGIYDLTEFLTGENWSTPGNPQVKRKTYRKIFFFSDAALTFAHGITGIVLTTHIYGSGTDGTNFFPIPYVSATAIANQIQVDVTPLNVVITKGGGAPAITDGTIVLEYLKN